MAACEDLDELVTKPANSASHGAGHNDLATCLERVIEAERSLAAVHQTLDALCAAPVRNASAEPLQRPPLLQSRSAGFRDDIVLKRANSGMSSCSVSNSVAPDYESSFVSHVTQANSVGASFAPEDGDMTRVASRLRVRFKYEESRVQHALLDQVIINGIYRRSTVQELRTSATMSFQESVAKETGALHGMHKPFDREAEIMRVYKNCHLPILHPEARLRIVWMIFGFAFIAYECCAVPFFIAFSYEPRGIFWILSTTINVYFLLDIPVSFFSGYKDRSGLVIMSPYKVWLHYACSWLSVDCICAVPWEWFETGDDYSFWRSARIFKSIRLLRILRFLRVLRFIKHKDIREAFQILMESHQKFVIVIGMVRVIVLIFVITHWCACLWYYVGRLESESETTLSWVDVHLSQYPDIGHRYVISLYFTMTTMTTVGYGDIHPQTYLEVCFGLVLLWVASIVFAALMGTLTDLIHNVNNKRRVVAQKKEQLGAYMQWRNVPKDLRQVIRTYLLFMWDDKGYEFYEQEVKSQLSPVLRTELCNHVYGQIILAAPFLAWMKDYDACVKQLTTMVHSIFLECGDYIFRRGQQNDQTFMLLSGAVWISRNQHFFTAEPPSAKKKKDPLGLLTLMAKEDDHATTPTSTNNVYEAVKRMEKAKGQSLASRFLSMVQRVRRSGTVDGFGTAGFAAPEAQKRGDSGVTLFRSQVLKEASYKQHESDQRQRRAAKKVQHWWRKVLVQPLPKPAARGDRVTFTSQMKSNWTLGLNNLPSRTIRAPAYFGEACLWFPMNTWNKEPPPVFMYNAQCRVRTEVVTIPRQALQTICDQYSPWLGERFEKFRKDVVNGLDALSRGHRKKSESEAFDSEHMNSEDFSEAAEKDGAADDETITL